MRRAATSTLRIASLTIGTSSGSPPSSRLHLERLAGGQLDQPADRSEQALAVDHLAALELVRPPLALGERRRRRCAHGQRRPAQRLGRRRGPRPPAGARSGAASVPARRTIAASRPATVTLVPSVSRRGRAAGHVEAAVQAVRTPDATRLQLGRSPRRHVASGSASPRCRARAARQSTMSTSTWQPSPVAAALTTVRSAWAVRPPRPITLP